MAPDIKCLEKELADHRGEVSIALVWQDAGLAPSAKALDKAGGNALSKLIKGGLFLGKEGEFLLVPMGGASKAKFVLLLGLGNQTDARLNTLRNAGGYVAQAAQRHRLKKAAMAITDFHFTGAYDEDDLFQCAQAFVEGVLLRDYEFASYHTAKDPAWHLEEVTLVGPKGSRSAFEAGAARGAIFADNANFARTLVNLAPNTKTPSYLAARAREIAAEAGGDTTVKVLDRKACEKLGMGSFLGVAQGSVTEPQFIVLEYKPKGAKKGTIPTIALVGKAITFDTGGISLKPAQGMESMKYDMAGGAGVLGAMRAITQLKPDRHVVAIVPATDNMPDGNAIHPADVLRSQSGKSIEIISTDAEGRLILADGLEYAQQFEPDACVDMATLTGAVVVALGSVYAGLMSNNPHLARQLVRSGRLVHERLWELPLDKEYFEQIKSLVADSKNSGGREAGSTIGGVFLQQFIGTMSWAHLDIAGMAWEEKGKAYIDKGATGYGVRLLTQFVLDFEKPTAG